MKNLLILFIMLCFIIPAKAIMAPSDEDYQNFLKSLSLSEEQKIEMELIEDESDRINQELNKELKEARELYQYCNPEEESCMELAEKIKHLNSEIYKNYERRNERILNILHFWQKKLYIEYNSRIY